MIDSAEYHHPIKPQGRSNDEPESTDASCYLYFQGGSVVLGAGDQEGQKSKAVPGGSAAASSGKEVVTVSVQKKEGNHLGLTLSEVDDKLVCTRVKEGGLVAGTELAAGMEIFGINGIKVAGKSSAEAAGILADAKGTITIVAFKGASHGDGEKSGSLAKAAAGATAGREVIAASVEKKDRTDAFTAQAEAMTQAEFADFQRERVDQWTNLFIARIRHAILTQNEHGEFVQHRISPSVLTDDWVLRATHFVKTVVDRNQQKEAIIQLQMVDKKKGFFYEVWLNVKVKVPSNNSYSLPLLMFTKKEEDQPLQACLDKIMASVHEVLETQFSANNNCTVAPLATTRVLWRPCGQNYKPVGNGDSRLSSALGRIQALKARGAGKAEIKAEMERLRAQRRRGPEKRDDLEEGLPLVSKEGESKQKYAKKGLWDSVLVYRQAPRYWSSAHNSKSDGVTWWVWKGLLASMAVYYVYSWMRSY